VANDIALLKNDASISVEQSAAHSPVTVIEARAAWRFVDLGELWRYRELALFPDLARRQGPFTSRPCWARRGPSCSRSAQMVVFSIFFGLMVEVPSGGVPYPLFVFAGLCALDLLSATPSPRPL